MKLVKPKALQKGDTIALVSPSSGLAGEPQIMWRTKVGIERLEGMGFKVKVMPNALKGIAFNYNHPQARAEDLMAAFKDEEVKAIICTLGGDDSVRLLPYIDFEVIRNNPKIFTGYSDSTFPHFLCMKAGLSSFYGPALLTDFAENVEMDSYTLHWFNKIFMDNSVIGEIPVSEEVRVHGLRWDIENKDINRDSIKNDEYVLLQGEQTVQGKLIGGCVELLNSLRGLDIYPELEMFDDTILFLETSEVHSPEWLLEDFFRTLGAQGILERINGILFARPQNGVLYKEYQPIITKLMKEWNAGHKPVLYNASFGHNEPKFTVPYGRLAEINVEKKTFSILESAVE